MFKNIEIPASCGVGTVIRFLDVRNMQPCYIHRQMMEVYGINVMDG